MDDGINLMASTIEASGAEIIIKLLERQNVPMVAGIPGGSILPLYDALVYTKSPLKHILVRQEQAAGFFAQGIARSTGKPGVCFATSGPGAMNLLTAVADARADSVPLVIITGQVNTECIGTDAFQEVDTFGLSFPITKHSIMVKSPEELLTAIPEAFSLASSGRPGPVLIDVPRNIQLEKASFPRWPEPGETSRNAAWFRTPAPLYGEILDRAADLLAGAERPVILAGGGCNSPEGASSLAKLLEAFPVPVAVTLMGLGCIPAENPLFMGMVGMHGSLTANKAVHRCDVLLALGTRFDDRAAGLTEDFCPKAKIIQIDIDAAEIDKLLPVELSIVGDLESALPVLAHMLRKNKTGNGKLSSWIEANRKAFTCERKRFPSSVKDFISSMPEQAEKEGLNPENLLITTDVGQHQMWAAQSYPVLKPRQFLTSGSLGTMGFGLPAAMGAAAVNPGKRIICLSGDGSIQMNIQELATLAENNFNVTVIVFDNGILGMIRQQQDFSFGGRHSACIYKKAPDLLKIAEAYGISTADANSPGWEKTAFEGSGPRFIRFKVPPEEDVFPFVVPGTANIKAVKQKT